MTYLGINTNINSLAVYCIEGLMKDEEMKL